MFPTILILISLGVLILPLILTVLNVANLFLRRPFKPDLVERLIMIIGPVFTVLLFILWSPKDYNQPLQTPATGELNWHTPLASWHAPAVLFLVILSLVGYGIIRKYKTKLPPLTVIICLSCMMMGSLIGLSWIIQLSTHLFDQGVFIPGEALYLCFFPFNYIICFIDAAKKLISEYTERISENKYRNPVLAKCFLLLQNSSNWPVIAIVMTIPVLVVVILVLTLFGQQPDAIIKAFTETSDWLLSQKTAPVPIEATGHYLCTVSLKGHHSIVKPLRYGIRRNNKIVVNRQLCVANAFEQLTEERIPKIHHFIRAIYDKYGYPISKHINSPMSADLIYILMKPLEWFFVAVLYLCDEKPENRIAMQYITTSQIEISSLKRGY